MTTRALRKVLLQKSIPSGYSSFLPFKVSPHICPASIRCAELRLGPGAGTGNMWVWKPGGQGPTHSSHASRRLSLHSSLPMQRATIIRAAWA